MQTLDDRELLREYVTRGDDDAFAVLVSRHVNMVYAVAFRHTGNSHSAEEITQAVFVVFARKAASLRSGAVVSGWLFHAARLTASNFLRNEIRRTRREQEAAMQSIPSEPDPADDTWQTVAPLLDRAIASLGETDRNAIVLRFLEGRDYKQVAGALGAGEEAAKKRVSRAVDKLRNFFSRRGIVLSGVALTAAVTANSAPAAPAGLAASAATLAAANGTTAGASTLALVKATIKVMKWTQFKIAAGLCAALLLIVGAGITFAEVRQGSAVPATTDNLTVQDIVKKVQDTYASLTSYKDSGTTTQEEYGANGKTNGIDIARTTFSILLGRPGFYRTEALMEAQPRPSAAWSAGDGDFTMPLTGGGKYYRVDKPVRALTMSAAAADIPMIFFKVGPNFLLRGREMSRGADEKVGEVDCRVIVNTMRLDDGAVTTFKTWVGRDDWLIHQWQATTKMKPADVAKGAPAAVVTTETHENISTDDPVKKEDFIYQPPPGAVLSELPKPATGPGR